MARYTGPKEKIERALGEKLFLKGERSYSPKSAIIKRPYPPGMHGRKRRRRYSEYALQLKSKQKIKNIYKVLEKQFRRYVEEALKTKGRSDNLLVEKLERRLDNIVFRLGFTRARDLARQLVTHGHFLVNDKIVNIPSFQVKPGDKIALKEHKKSLTYFSSYMPQIMKQQEIPSWLDIDKNTLIGYIKSLPILEETGVDPKDLQNIIELYSR